MPTRRIKPDRMWYAAEVPVAAPEVASSRRLLDLVKDHHLLGLFFHASVLPVRSRKGLRGDAGQGEHFLVVGARGSKVLARVRVVTRRKPMRVEDVETDLAMCRKAFPDLTPRLVTVQFIKEGGGESILLHLLTIIDGVLTLNDRKHYRLVPASEIARVDVATGTKLE